jgi:MOSC domain-containing protein YiiM
MRRGFGNVTDMARLEAIFVAPGKAAPMEALDEVDAIAGAGLAGDRYAEGSGTFSRSSPDRHVTLIEVEALEAAERDYGISIPPEGTRRNLLTRGAYLNHLVDRIFHVGDVRLRGVELCEPCDTLEKSLGKPGVRGALLHRGGLRAEILEGGTLKVGDKLEL